MAAGAETDAAQGDPDAGRAVADGPVAGVDEAGRGPLAGPLVAAAVILDPGRPIDGLTDSKRLGARRREALASRIRAEALAFALAWVEPAEVDDLNVLRATMAAMARAVDGLAGRPARVLVDGDRCPELGLPVRAVVGGDASEPAISAASILAKVERDRRMAELDVLHPGYGFAAHKGYGTRAHVAALRRLGPCAAHRRSFAPVRAAARQGVLALDTPGVPEGG
ncbi:MAG: ribonuclease HII [Halofilum sp. (in: g-proteobacteria)]|nr:ribonuclease HII [Halofilum sp. (in: g-proteobacteria)]